MRLSPTLDFAAVVLAVGLVGFLNTISTQIEGGGLHLNNPGVGEERLVPQIPSPSDDFIRKAVCPETVPAHFLGVEVETDYWTVTAYAIGDPYTPGRNTADGWAQGLRREVRPGVTAACPTELPLGTIVCIDDLGCRVCEDRGAFRDKHIDVAFRTPALATVWGVQSRRVAIIRCGNAVSY